MQKPKRIMICGDSVMSGDGHHYVVRYSPDVENKPIYFEIDGEPVSRDEYYSRLRVPGGIR